MSASLERSRGLQTDALHPLQYNLLLSRPAVISLRSFFLVVLNVLLMMGSRLLRDGPGGRLVGGLGLLCVALVLMVSVAHARKSSAGALQVRWVPNQMWLARTRAPRPSLQSHIHVWQATRQAGWHEEEAAASLVPPRSLFERLNPFAASEARLQPQQCPNVDPVPWGEWGRQ